MKIYFLYNIIDGPFGGANQFFKILKQYLKERGVVTESPKDADVVVFNSHSLGGGKGEVFPKVLALRKMYPEKIFVHRVDGPVSMYRGGRDVGIDREIYRINAVVSDATIFQSRWSKKENKQRGMVRGKHEAVITNAPDPNIFYPDSDRPNHRERIRIVAVSWSHHEGKGFDVYRFLDEHLDHDRYEMTFIGNSPVRFKYIHMLPPMASEALAQKLRESDIFITASKNDPCSNALLEALHSGLPAVVRSSGGHPEIVGHAGEIFHDTSDVLYAIETVARDISEYRSRIIVSTIQEIGTQYLAFFDHVVEEASPRVLSWQVSFSFFIYYGVRGFLVRVKGVGKRMLKKALSIL
jgi:glycosyltransferase involved in cell wall biosynthesis